MIRVPLFLPAHRIDRLAGAVASGADCVILDLEDGVPADQKAAARAAVAALAPQAIPIALRINAEGTPWHDEDCAAARASLVLAAVMLPKCEAPPEADRFPGKALWPLIETVAGLANARRIAAAPAVERLAFGSVDYSADAGCAHIREALLHARSELVVASRLARILAPLDGVFLKLDDTEGAAAEARYARELGFAGKMAIHPRQIAALRSGFAPDAEQLAWARRVMAAGEDTGAVSIDGMMIDAPVRQLAVALLSEAALAD
ncbi:MAG: CoA ester lyase [Pseudomonadota bacterium]